MSQELKIPATWTPDCQGKKDFDGNIVIISTRYWPSKDYSAIGGAITKPSAHSSIQIQHGEEYTPGYTEENVVLVDKEFECDTPEQVFAEVGQWAQQQMNEIVKVLKEHFKKS